MDYLDDLPDFYQEEDWDGESDDHEQTQDNSTYYALIDSKITEIIDSKLPLLPEEFLHKYSAMAHKWLDDLSMYCPTEEEIFSIAPILALEAGVDSLQKANIPTLLIGETIQRSVEKIQRSDLVKAIDAGYVDKSHFPDVFHEIAKELLTEKIRETKKDTIPTEIVLAFEKQYGSSDYAEGFPLRAYALRRMLYEEVNPKNFWGKELFEYHKKFIGEFEGIKNIEKLADEIYNQEAGNIGHLVFSEDDSEKIMSENLPEDIQTFEEKRKEKGVAITCLTTDLYYIDDEIVDENLWFRNVLEEINDVEYPEKKKAKEKRFEFLDDIALTKGKRTKIQRIADHNTDFMTYLQSLVNGENNYLDTKEENQLITTQLQELGVQTNIFYSSTDERSFVFKKGEKINASTLRKEKIDVYKSSMMRTFSKETIQAPQNLLAKLNSNLKMTDKDLEQLLQLTNDKDIRIVCNTTSTYLSKKQNSLDTQETQAIAYHLREVADFLSGRSKQEEESDTYTIKISRKNPFSEIDIGNDGGCCIGIYTEEGWTKNSFMDYLQTGKELPVESNGSYMPFYLKDKATQFIEIYKGQKRNGLALLFAGKNEKNEPVLAVNSIEFSEQLISDGNREKVEGETLKFIKDYATKAGFKHVLIGNYLYPHDELKNTDTAEFTEYSKIHPWKESFYSDIINQGEKTSIENFELL